MDTSSSNTLIGNFKNTAFVVVRYLWSRINDLYLNIDTSDVSHHNDFDPQRGFPYAKPQAKAKHKDSIIYQGANFWNIRRIIRILQPQGNDVFFDIGCGKGRCLCMFGRLPLRRVVGIELDPSLVEAARSNAKRLRGKRTPIEVRCQDAATADYSEGTIYFLYWPFGIDTMKDVLENIKRSVDENPRAISIVYYHATHADVLQSAPWLQRVQELKTLTGYPITFFVNTPRTPQGAGRFGN
jgi:SAM-dependent methyltransferase